MEIDVNQRKYVQTCYWDLVPQKTINKDYETVKEKVHQLLIDAVKLRLKSDVPFGSFLSGGIDSALISSIAAKYGTNTLNTFSIGFEEKEYDESSTAREYSKIIGSNHKETICRSSDVIALIDKLVEVYDEPFADSSALPSLLLNKVTKQHVTVALSGDGGDESFLGYTHFVFVNMAQKYFMLPKFLRKVIKKILSFLPDKKHIDRAKKLSSIDDVHDFIGRLFIGFETLLLKRDLSWFQKYRKYFELSNNITQNCADLNIKLWLENDSNVKVDRSSMAFSVEVRSPFLDYRIVEYARSLPVSYRYNTNVRKRILKDILREYMPEEVFNLPKRGFAIPLEKWIREDLREEFSKVLNDKFLDLIPNFNKLKFNKMYHDHLNGKKKNTEFIWRVFVLSKWYKEFGYCK